MVQVRNSHPNGPPIIQQIAMQQQQMMPQQQMQLQQQQMMPQQQMQQMQHVPQQVPNDINLWNFI